MSASSSPESLYSSTLWWPVERVPLQVEIVVPRRLTALEWALLRVMDEFRADPPPLTEVAEELGLEDPAFLRATLAEVLRRRALEPRGEASAELADLTFTELGERLYRRGQIEGAPSTRGVVLHVDALTDEDLPQPPRFEESVERGFLEDALGVPRDTLGLERVRGALGRLHGDILKGDAEVRAVRSAADGAEVDEPDLIWRPVELRVELDAQGRFALRAEALTKKATEFLRSHDLLAQGLLPTRPISQGWGETSPGRLRGVGVMVADWRRRISEPIPAAQVTTRACRLVREARTEVVLHACWTGADGLPQELAAAVQRGVRVLVVGAGRTALFAWSERAFGVEVDVGAPQVGALIVDGARGLSLDDVTAPLGERTATLELAGATRGATAGADRDALVQAALARIPRPTPSPAGALRSNLEALANIDNLVDNILGAERLRLALVRLALLPAESELEGLLAEAAALAPGLERVPLLRRLAARCRELAPGLAAGALVRAWRESWEAVAASARSRAPLPEALFEQLATWAPSEIPAERWVDLAVDAWALQADAPDGIGARLLRISRIADSRWGVGKVRAVASWRAARDRLAAIDDWDEGRLRRLVEILLPLFSPREARDWAKGAMRLAPCSPTAEGVARWLSLTEALRRASGPEHEALLAEALTARALPSWEGRYDAAEIREAWLALGGADEALLALVTPATPADRPHKGQPTKSPKKKKGKR